MLEKDDYIYGIRAVIEAIEAGKEIDKVMVNRDLRGDLIRELMGVIKSHGVRALIALKTLPVKISSSSTTSVEIPDDW